MRLLSVIPFNVVVLVCLALFPSYGAADGNTYFVVNSPKQGTQWVNGAAQPVSWSKGLLDNVPTVDVELARLSTDGLIYIASNVPSQSALNVLPQDVPTGDDYYLIFLNSTHGLMYGLSPRFSIVASGTSVTNASSPLGNAPTATISGGPNPTLGFATTFPAIAASGALPRLNLDPALYISLVTAVLTCTLGASWTLL